MMRISMFLLTAGIFMGVASLAQTNVAATHQRQTAEEDRVARLVDTIRKERGLKPLKHVIPSEYEVGLVCSAAATGRPLWELTHEGKTDLASFQVYRTQDIADRSTALTFLASDEVLRRKDFPHYSVIVFKDVSQAGMLARISHREYVS